MHWGSHYEAIGKIIEEIIREAIGEATRNYGWRFSGESTGEETGESHCEVIGEPLQKAKGEAIEEIPCLFSSFGTLVE